jgi:transposase
MRALAITRSDVTPEALLDLAATTPGAWLGVKIAVVLLVRAGQRPSALTALFGISRTTVTSWVHRVNREGVQGLRERARPGRPSQLTPRIRRQVDAHLAHSPTEYGWSRAQWDGPMLVQHLRKYFGVRIKVRQAQNWLHHLGYRLKRAGYSYVQARAEDARQFRDRLKKDSPH